jgi:hypothetical protein
MPVGFDETRPAHRLPVCATVGCAAWTSRGLSDGQWRSTRDRGGHPGRISRRESRSSAPIRAGQQPGLKREVSSFKTVSSGRLSEGELCLLPADSSFEDGSGGGLQRSDLDAVCLYAGRTRRCRVPWTNRQEPKGDGNTGQLGGWAVARNENLSYGCLGGQSVSVGADDETRAAVRARRSASMTVQT